MSRWTDALASGQYDEVLRTLYGKEKTPRQWARWTALAETFRQTFGEGEPAFFSAPGRTEVGGNHTDHQHGRVLCAAVDPDILACAAPNGTRVIRVRSAGFPPLTVDLADLSPRPGEAGTSEALVRGMAAQAAERGFPVSGFDACLTSDIPAGAGLSSSAAYEVLMGEMLNRFFCAGGLDPVTIAKMAQKAENVYFGKPCGLMDQMGCALGGAVAIDFRDPAQPVVERLDFPLDRFGCVLCLVDTGSDHADLTDEYAAVPREMGAVASYFEKSVLREVPEKDFRGAIPALRAKCGDRAVLRAAHFYEDDRRAAAEADAIRAGDREKFLALVNASGLSSQLQLQNCAAETARQPIPLALSMGRRLLEGDGAIRVHGGGFAGAVQAFVPIDRLEVFRREMDRVFGPGSCKVLSVRPVGVVMVQ